MSSVQGGAGFPFFSEEVYKYFTTGEFTDVKFTDSDIPDPEVRMLVSQITACDYDPSLVELFSDSTNYSKLADTGYSKPPARLNINDKVEITEILVNFHCLLKVKAGMDQFLDGLDAIGLRKFLYSHPDVMKPLFTLSKYGTVCLPLPVSNRVPHLPGCVLAPLPLPPTQYLHRLFTGEPHPPRPWSTKYYVVDPSVIPGLTIQEVSLGVYFAGKPPPAGTSPTPQPFSLALGETKMMPTRVLSASYEVLSIWSHSYQFYEDRSTISLTLS